MQLIEERDRALAALKELEFDHRTGKLEDADYRQLVGPYRRAAATALRALERSESGDLGQQNEVQTDDRGGDDDDPAVVTRRLTSGPMMSRRAVNHTRAPA